MARFLWGFLGAPLSALKVLYWVSSCTTRSSRVPHLSGIVVLAKMCCAMGLGIFRLIISWRAVSSNVVRDARTRNEFAKSVPFVHRSAYRATAASKEDSIVPKVLVMSLANYANVHHWKVEVSES